MAHDPTAFLRRLPSLYRCPRIRRERTRGDRTIGEGRSHLIDNGVGSFGPYDFEIDTSVGSTTSMAERLSVALSNKPIPSAFQRIADLDS